MRTWQVQDAKARFSELLDASLKEGPQVVTRRGVEGAALVPIEQWRRLQRAARPTLKELLLARDRDSRDWSRPGDRGAAGRRQSSSESTCSELRRPRPRGAVLAWVRTIPHEHLHLSAVTLSELQASVEITRERDPDKAAEIEAWIGRITGTYNVLPLDGPCFVPGHG
jgi:prevent-host-death family protein